MKKKLKERLKTAFDVPGPKRKKEFLASVNFPKISWFGFFICQAGYIRKRVWIVSCAIAAAALSGLRFYTEENILNFVWLVSSVLPFVSLVTMTEIARSSSYNMAELEMGCKYNFTGVVLVRLGILSCFNAAVFALIAIPLSGKIDYNIFRLGVYLLAPFMLTCLLSLSAINRLRSRETTYICGGISCFVSIAKALLAVQRDRLFSDEYLLYWSITFIILLLLAARETIRLIKKTEELQWNLSLTG